jgi:hypothetical protein
LPATHFVSPQQSVSFVQPPTQIPAVVVDVPASAALAASAEASLVAPSRPAEASSAPASLGALAVSVEQMEPHRQSRLAAHSF